MLYSKAYEDRSFDDPGVRGRLQQRIHGRRVQYRSSPEQRAAYWGIALGLQAIDGLQPSGYLTELVKQNIAGTLGYRKVTDLLKNYYAEKAGRGDVPGGAASRQQEADLAVARINELYQVPGFDLSAEGFKEYHRYIFQDTMLDAGSFKKVALWKSGADPVR
jgi:hypothetical protein